MPTPTDRTSRGHRLDRTHTSPLSTIHDLKTFLRTWKTLELGIERLCTVQKHMSRSTATALAEVLTQEGPAPQCVRSTSTTLSVDELCTNIKFATSQLRACIHPVTCAHFAEKKTLKKVVVLNSRRSRASSGSVVTEHDPSRFATPPSSPSLAHVRQGASGTACLGSGRFTRPNFGGTLRACKHTFSHTFRRALTRIHSLHSNVCLQQRHSTFRRTSSVHTALGDPPTTAYLCGNHPAHAVASLAEPPSSGHTARHSSCHASSIECVGVVACLFLSWLRDVGAST
jgi:hypothetical protein